MPIGDFPWVGKIPHEVPEVGRKSSKAWKLAAPRRYSGTL
jgi:hypothetical protein